MATQPFWLLSSQWHELFHWNINMSAKIMMTCIRFWFAVVMEKNQNGCVVEDLGKVYTISSKAIQLEQENGVPPLKTVFLYLKTRLKNVNPYLKLSHYQNMITSQCVVIECQTLPILNSVWSNSKYLLFIFTSSSSKILPNTVSFLYPDGQRFLLTPPRMVFHLKLNPT